MKIVDRRFSVVDRIVLGCNGCKNLYLVQWKVFNNSGISKVASDGDVWSDDGGFGLMVDVGYGVRYN